MRETECRHGLILVCELRELFDHGEESLTSQDQSFTHQKDIGVIADIAGCGAEVDDALCLRTLFAVSMHMRHNVMTNEFLFAGCDVVVDIFLTGLELGDLFISDVKSQFFFTGSQVDPQLSPCLKLMIRREDRLHFFTRIAGIQRALINILHDLLLQKFSYCC